MRQVSLCQQIAVAVQRASARAAAIGSENMRLNRCASRIGIVVVAGGLLVAGCGQPESSTPVTPPAAQATAAPTTAEVLKIHMDAFGAGNLDAMLGGYTDDAVMFTPSGTVQGKEALRPVFTGLFAEWGKPTTKFTLKQNLVAGEHAYIFWDAETDDNIYEGGMDAFVIRNGKKVAHFFSAKITPKKKPS
jgi:ketosteroid isomerase-like protein